MLPVVSGYLHYTPQPRFRPTEQAAVAEDPSVVVPALEAAEQGRADSFVRLRTALRSFAENLFTAILTARPKLVTVTVNAPGYAAYTEQREINGFSYAVAITSGEGDRSASLDDLALTRLDTAPTPLSTRGPGTLLDRRI